MTGHGGKRPGAGRPKDPNAKQTICLRVTPEVREYLAQTANASQAVDDTIRRSQAYRKWQKSH